MRIHVPSDLQEGLVSAAKKQGVSPSQLMALFIQERLNINLPNSPLVAKDTNDATLSRLS